jgi:hypothetical protein
MWQVDYSLGALALPALTVHEYPLSKILQLSEIFYPFQAKGAFDSETHVAPF